MCPEVEIVLLPQPKLIIVIIQAFLGQSDHLSSILQTNLTKVVLREVYFPPLLDDLYDLEDNALLAALTLE